MGKKSSGKKKGISWKVPERAMQAFWERQQSLTYGPLPQSFTDQKTDISGKPKEKRPQDDRPPWE